MQARLGLAGLTAALVLAGSPGMAQAPAASSLTPAQIVAARQTGFHLSAANFGAMKSAVDVGAEVKTQAYAARGLARWARTLPTLFPQGTGPGVGESRAKAEIWSKRADFEAKAAAYTAASTRLVELAEAGDKAAFLEGWNTLRTTCSACHDVYRAPPARRAGS